MASPQVTVSLPQRTRNTRRRARSQSRLRQRQQQATQISRQKRNGRRRRRRQQQQQPQQQSNRKARTVVRREVERLGLTGPAPTIVQRATATLGPVQPNQSGNLELEFQMCLNPSLVKESTGSNQFGPIQISASTYSLWKLRSAIFSFQPLVGSSAVSGTVYRISLNLSGSPGSNSWSALGARHHMDVTPGQARKFFVPKKMLQGTKEGWFMTDPKADPTNSLGGSIEVHSLGRTMSTYQSTQFSGDLFLLEMTATWEFTNYNVQPGLLTMVKDEHQSKVELTSEGNGSPLIMEVPVNSTLSNYTGGATHATSANGTLGETIWSIVDTGVNTLSGAVPQPFGWLIKGGWWFVRRILGRKVNASNEEVAQFYVYQTLADAQNDNRCITTSSDTATVSTGEYSIQQITPGNVGLPDSPPTSGSLPVIQPFDPTQNFNVVTRYQQLLRPTTPVTNQFVVNLAQGGTISSSIRIPRSSGPDPFFFSVAKLEGPIFMQDGQVMNPDVSTFSTGLPLVIRTTDTTTQFATAVAYASYNVDFVNGHIIRLVHLLAYNVATQVITVSVESTKLQNLLLSPAWVTSTDNPPQLRSVLEVATITGQTYAESVTLPANSWLLFTTAGSSDVSQLYGIDFGNNNHIADFSDHVAATNIPGDTPWNPLSTGWRLSPIPRSTQRIHWDYRAYDEVDDKPSIPELSDDEWDVSDVDDDDGPPLGILESVTDAGRVLYDKLRKLGLTHRVALTSTQAAEPSPAFRVWQTTYHDALVDGNSPPTARHVAYREATQFL